MRMHSGNNDKIIRNVLKSPTFQLLLKCVELHNDIVLKTCRTLGNRNLKLQSVHNAIGDTS